MFIHYRAKAREAITLLCLIYGEDWEDYMPDIKEPHVIEGTYHWQWWYADPFTEAEIATRRFDLVIAARNGESDRLYSDPPRWEGLE